MGMFVPVRGWIELHHTQRPAVEEILQRHHYDLYSGGWTISTTSGWSLYVHFGCDIREPELSWFRQQLDELAVIEPIIEDGDMPAGMFLLNEEGLDSTWWIVRDGGVQVRPAPEFGWLNE